MKPIAMVSMELDDEDKIDAPMPYAMPDKPDYPYGLRICLTHEELDKLGFSHEDMIVGGTIHLHALGQITSVSSIDKENELQARVEIQIENLMIESEDQENIEY